MATDDRRLTISLTGDADSAVIQAWRAALPDGEVSLRARILLARAIQHEQALAPLLAELRALRDTLATGQRPPGPAATTAAVQPTDLNAATQALLDTLLDV